MSRPTVKELFDDIRQQADSAGVCTVEDLTTKMNNIAPLALDSIDAQGMLWQWCLCTCAGAVAMPPTLRAVRQAWWCGEPMGFRSEWWEGQLGGDVDFKRYQEFPWREMIDTPHVTPTQTLVGEGADLCFELRGHPDDAGVEIEVRYQNAKGLVKLFNPKLPAEARTIASEPGIGEVTRFHKPRTKFPVELWKKNVRTGARSLVSIYRPAEETPSYQVKKISGCSRSGTLLIQGVRQWLPLREETDIVPFGGVIAWRFLLAAEAASAATDSIRMGGMLTQAVGVLEAEKRAIVPKGQRRTVKFLTPWTVDNRFRYP